MKPLLLFYFAKELHALSENQKQIAARFQAKPTNPNPTNPNPPT